MKEHPERFPEYVYRYRSADLRYRIEEIDRLIKGREAFMFPIAHQNDPFDCNPSYEDRPNSEVLDFLRKHRDGCLLTGDTFPQLLGSARTRAQRRQLRSFYKADAGNVGILADQYRSLIGEIRESTLLACYSGRGDSPLMWSHYAANHTGICFEFKVRPELFEKYDGRALARVVYSDHRPKITLLDLIAGFAPQPDDTKDVQARKEAVFDALYFTKPNDWSYEFEWRAISPFEEGKGYKQIFALKLFRVLSGLRCSEEVEGSLKDRFPQLDFQRVTMSSDSYQFTF